MAPSVISMRRDVGRWRIDVDHPPAHGELGGFVNTIILRNSRCRDDFPEHVYSMRPRTEKRVSCPSKACGLGSISLAASAVVMQTTCLPWRAPARGRDAVWQGAHGIAGVAGCVSPGSASLGAKKRISAFGAAPSRAARISRAR